MAVAAGFVSLFTAGCAPELDWRLVRPHGVGVQLMLPCRPSIFARSIRLADEAVTWTLWSCQAGDATWALGYAEFADPRSVPAALRELLASAASNRGQVSGTRLPWAAHGFTPHADTGHWRWAGRLADGRPASGDTLNFALGPTVFQASVVTGRLNVESTDFFVASLQPSPRR
jgi:hypothetical protein